jgi:uncharacterized membrane-anchored protein
MTETTQDPARVKAEFKKRRTMLRLLLVPMALLLVAIVFLDESPTQSLLGIPAVGWIVLLVVALAGFVFYSVRYWRCPACNGWFGSRQSMRNCPKCGVELR